MEADRSQAADRGRIFIIEDDSAVLASLKFSLEVDGYAVSAFLNETSLLDSVGQQESGCLVIDYHLPDGNGLDLLRQLRARGVAIPAILITSDPDPSLRRAAAAAGTPIVEKPLVNDALKMEIQKALSATFPNAPD